MKPITVMIVDGDRTRQAACRRRLRGERDMRVVPATRGRRSDRRPPRVLLLDENVAGPSEIALRRILGRQIPRTRVILLVERATVARILRGLSCGARGCLDTIALRSFLPRAVRLVDAGEVWVSRTMVSRILARLTRLAA
jgi:DNA-binding NarL/FixJ family response regulator